MGWRVNPTHGLHACRAGEAPLGLGDAHEESGPFVLQVALEGLCLHPEQHHGIKLQFPALVDGRDFIFAEGRAPAMVITRRARFSQRPRMSLLPRP